MRGVNTDLGVEHCLFGILSGVVAVAEVGQAIAGICGLGTHACAVSVSGIDHIPEDTATRTK